MKETYYFSHDYNTRTDEKIKKLIRKHGMLGYGVFWAIVEDLYNNDNILETDYEGISYELRVDQLIVQSVINDFSLFVIDGDKFGSLSVQKRIDERDERSRKASRSAKKRWNKVKEQCEESNIAMPTHSEGNAIKERKGKDIKDIKDIKDNIVKNTYQASLLSKIDKSTLDERTQYYFDTAIAFYELFKKITLEAGGTITVLEKAKGTWIDDIRKLIEIDKAEPEKLREIWKWLPTSDFWSKNIASTSKLRAKYNELIKQMNYEKNRRNPKEGTTWDELAEITAKHFGVKIE